MAAPGEAQNDCKAPDEARKRRLILSSGGQWGASFIGAVKALEQQHSCQNLATHFTSFEGTSAGGICAFLLALGSSSLDLLLIYTQIPEYCPTFTRLPTHYGLCAPRAYAGPLLLSALKRAGLTEHTTFRELTAARGVSLVLGLTLLGPAQQRYSMDASVETTPDWPVLPCVLGTMAIPVLFDYVEIAPGKGEPAVYALDGALTNGFRFPAAVDPNEEVLGILLSPAPGNTENPEAITVPFLPGSHTVFDYFLLVSTLFFHHRGLSRAAEFITVPHVISIPCGAAPTASAAADLSQLITKPSMEDLLNYMQVGEQNTRAFFAR